MRSTLVLALSAAVHLPAAVHAWGDIGHRTIALLAEKYFTPASASLVSGLLGDTEDATLSDGATWADSVRRQKGFTQTAPWHYIDAEDSPPQSCGVKYSRDCSPKEGCVVSAIVNQTGILLDTSQDDEHRGYALKFLLHFIGDVHQPLHTEALDRGGNEIKACFDNSCGKVNLHSIWDTNIIHKHLGLRHSEKHNEEIVAAKKWADELFADGSSSVHVDAECADVAGDPTKCALQWATEANKLVCTYVLKPGVEWLENNDLGDRYYEGAVPIVTTQITRAAARLAAWLNAVSAQVSERVDL